MNAAGCYRSRCFGTDWHSDLELELFDALPPTDSSASITVRLVTSLGDRPLQQISPRVECAVDGFRLQWEEEVTFDAFTRGDINVLPGAQWRGRLPPTFYSTVAATMLALRGLMPMHMSAIVLKGRAFLIGGFSGAGKSTIAARLINAGAEFLSDDLTILRPENGQLVATRGRSTMRLYPHVADAIECTQKHPIADDERGKFMVWPKHRAADNCYPLGGILFLGRDVRTFLSAEEKLRLLARSVFRPKILNQTPAAPMINQYLLSLAGTQNIMEFPRIERHETPDWENYLAQLLAHMDQTGQ